MTKLIVTFRNFPNAPNKENSNEDEKKRQTYEDNGSMKNGGWKETGGKNTVTASCRHIYTVKSLK
jgi:hypothetical protein